MCGRLFCQQDVWYKTRAKGEGDDDTNNASKAAVVTTKSVAASVSLQHVSIYNSGWNTEISGGEIDWGAVKRNFNAGTKNAAAAERTAGANKRTCKYDGCAMAAAPRHYHRQEQRRGQG